MQLEDQITVLILYMYINNEQRILEENVEILRLKVCRQFPTIYMHPLYSNFCNAILYVFACNMYEGPVPGSEIPPSRPFSLQIPLSRHASSQFPALDFFSNTVQRIMI